MTTIDRDELRKLAKEAHFWGGVEKELGDGVMELLDALDRAEAERDAARRDWLTLSSDTAAEQDRANQAEARLQAQRAAHADQIKYWQGEARIARDDATRAEERLRAVRDVIDHPGNDGPVALDIREALDGDA